MDISLHRRRLLQLVYSTAPQPAVHADDYDCARRLDRSSRASACCARMLRKIAIIPHDPRPRRDVLKDRQGLARLAYRLRDQAVGRSTDEAGDQRFLEQASRA